MSDLVEAGVVLVLAGLAIVSLALVRSAKGEGSVKGAGVVLIGPIPIVFGSDAKWATVALALAVVLMLLGIFAFRLA